MTPFINSAAISTTRLDSAALGPLAMVAHRFDEPGAYRGAVLQGDRVIGTFDLDVSEGDDRPQADLDLFRFGRTGSASDSKYQRMKLSAGGFALFFVSQGEAGFRVMVQAEGDQKSQEGKADTVFDSANLGQGDLFVATLLRPGEWTASASKEYTAQITVAYPEIGEKAYSPGDQANMITLSGRGLSPEKVEMGPGEGVVFQIEDGSGRVTLELAKPDEGPKRAKRAVKLRNQPKKPGRHARWTNPRQPRD